MKNADSKMSPIMRLARSLPELLNRSDRLGSSDDFERACEIESKIVNMAPRDPDDAVVLLALAAEFAETADYACKGGDMDNARADIKRLRAAVYGVLALMVEMTDFDLSLIGREEMRQTIGSAAAA
jgi:hypothetical protein